MYEPINVHVKKHLPGPAAGENSRPNQLGAVKLKRRRLSHERGQIAKIHRRPVPTSLRLFAERATNRGGLGSSSGRSSAGCLLLSAPTTTRRIQRFYAPIRTSQRVRESREAAESWPHCEGKSHHVSCRSVMYFSRFTRCVNASRRSPWICTILPLSHCGLMAIALRMLRNLTVQTCVDGLPDPQIYDPCVVT
jgi:hypothetical protein